MKNANHPLGHPPKSKTLVKHKPDKGFKIYLCPEQESNLHYLAITRF